MGEAVWTLTVNFPFSLMWVKKESFGTHLTRWLLLQNRRNHQSKCPRAGPKQNKFNPYGDCGSSHELRGMTYLNCDVDSIFGQRTNFSRLKVGFVFWISVGWKSSIRRYCIHFFVIYSVPLWHVFITICFVIVQIECLLAHFYIL